MTDDELHRYEAKAKKRSDIAALAEEIRRMQRLITEAVGWLGPYCNSRPIEIAREKLKKALRGSDD